MKLNYKPDFTDFSERKSPKGHAHRRCNVCSQLFRPRTPFERYCEVCREDSELLKFSEWLPELDEGFAEQISALTLQNQG